jgi:hypothetical protein
VVLLFEGSLDEEVLITLIAGLILARSPLWIANDFRSVSYKDGSNKDIWLIRLAKASWICGAVAGIVAFILLIDGYCDALEALILSLLWSIGVVVVSRGLVWAASGFFKSDNL